ncbi:hypothetical protein G7047_19120 [Diaphorobacter sp. HDW4A]|uniref:hypothetical protein n=1 Tax=Diaphorobacter sp. HDW4A TaxID=2714924 RepID=UPI0014099EA8|nr:hypothetical protein [Diaphorobacter sp. HDW4A]QIL81792.1 hypothetical protein G7047_19120 [Diaphorobacter sp. HDW4A]
MSQRRRFFPATRAQQIPGNTVEVEFQLQPEAQAAAEPSEPGACQCDIYGAMWSIDILQSGDGGYGSIYIEKAEFQDSRLVSGYIWIPSMEVSGVQIRASLLGRTLCDVSWRWELNTPPPPSGDYTVVWDGVEIEEQGNTVLVTVLPGEYFGTSLWFAELKLTAICAGEEVATLNMNPGFNLQNLYM